MARFRRAPRARIGLWIVSALALTGCGLPERPTTDVVSTRTLQAGTAAAALTEVASRITPPAPLATTEVPLASPLPSLTTAPLTTPSLTPASGCTDRATFLDDVTYRDNATVAADQAFVKIWRLMNSGTCTWTQDYALAFFGGERMGAAAIVPLSNTVPPQATVDLPVDMVAPSVPGTYQGYWRLQNARGEFFGIGPSGDQSFWVKVVVLSPLTVTVTSTPSPTPTPPVLAAGSASLELGISLDLDTGAVDPASGRDLAHVPATPGSALAPQPGASLGPYTPPPSPPNPAACLTAPLGTGSIPSSSLSAGMTFCYQTDQGRRGYLVIAGVGSSLSFAFTTWAP